MKKLAYLISKLTFWGFLIFSLILIPLSAFSFLEYYFNWDLPFVDIVKRDGLNFAKIKNIGVEFWLTYTVFLMWGTLIYYSIYFYVLKGFFKIFITQKTFEENSLKKLTLFYRINYIPVIIGFIGITIRYFMHNTLRFDEPHFFVLIHLILAFFLYFYLDLIRKGNYIQQENDLTI
ncbi:hypothetical protein BW723_09190 [Polaribacter reichenbachii]|uniref:DUF2975 domain-containing protein n=1 Tax=Polaribacter reichenbachii TaxID=996801 RepID=A0A1B8U7B7_9FLAO|nr:DUF2975 domain-containing protein [Polaribacter reichenbachii]APZ46460.1 hypothetical protein BW723_09190 [Polaribacter reichenbachii]AUC20325.1 hypothetical protein BTO17_17225 [Polaribacter reichenbachii]OBY67774.1 hypothetical protein LPB301_00310 [Polaribacter reichenbachii]